MLTLILFPFAAVGLLGVIDVAFCAGQIGVGIAKALGRG